MNKETVRSKPVPDNKFLNRNSGDENKNVHKAFQSSSVRLGWMRDEAGKIERGHRM